MLLYALYFHLWSFFAAVRRFFSGISRSHITTTQVERTPPKTIIVVGAATGIGRATVEYILRSNGAPHTVIAADINVDGLQSLQRKYKSQRQTCRLFVHSIDVSNETSVDEFFQWCKSGSSSSPRINQIDILFYSVGFFLGSPLIETPRSKFFGCLNVNFLSVQNIVHVPFKMGFLSSQVSRVVIVTSETAYCHPIPYGEPYAMTKYALDFLVRGLRMELSICGISVISVVPGAVETKVLDASSKMALVPEDSPFFKAASLVNKVGRYVTKFLRRISPDTCAENACIPAMFDRKPFSMYFVNLSFSYWIQQFTPAIVYDTFLAWVLSWQPISVGEV